MIFIMKKSTSYIKDIGLIDVPYLVCNDIRDKLGCLTSELINTITTKIKYAKWRYSYGIRCWTSYKRKGITNSPIGSRRIVCVYFGDCICLAYGQDPKVISDKGYSISIIRPYLYITNQIKPIGIKCLG